MDAGISLTEVSDALLLSSSHRAVPPLSRHVLQAFGEDQLPAVVLSTVPTSDSQQQALSDSALQERWASLTGLGIFDTYLSWVQETLLMVISEVASSSASALSSSGPNDQQVSQPAVHDEGGWQCQPS
jgi:hypothetical protein